MDCDCKKKNCPRHGHCDACRNYHRGSKRVPHCERKTFKRRGRLLLPIVSLIVVSMVITIAVYSTKRIIDNKYKPVQEMQIMDIDITQLPDGEYSGTYSYGKNHYSVKALIENRAIADINLSIDTRESNQRYVQLAAALTMEVIQNQSLQVDSISGATRSSKAVLKALENAFTHP